MRNLKEVSPVVLERKCLGTDKEWTKYHISSAGQPVAQLEQ